LLAAQFDKDRVGLSDAQELRSLGNHREIPGRKLVEGPFCLVGEGEGVWAVVTGD
jgi:hypothetical protein